MKEKEIELTNILNTKIKELNLKNTTNEFSYYDATNQHYIIEYKIRFKHYNEQFIQVDKLYNLLMIAEYQNKIPVYIVSDPKGIFIYNLNKNKGYFLNSKIEVIKSPYQTEFKKNKKIDKYYYLLTEKQLSKKLIN
tara:strand:- start:52 stop:459 length:408 start_codon:yes stop_codon:yes gene_type:complete